MEKTIANEVTTTLRAASVVSHGQVEATTVLDQIGNTPLLDLSEFAWGLGVSAKVGVYAKAEWYNPGGSIKARAALRIVEEAERSGQ